MSSIKDVAKVSGVSTATISRIINNNPLVSMETREKVLRVMKDLNYVPNSMARGLSNQKSYTIALLINVKHAKSFYNPFFYEVMHGIEATVYSKDFCLIIANQQTSHKKDDMLKWLIRGKRSQGVIIPSSIIDAQNVRELKKIGYPFVVIGEPGNTNEPIDWVDINNNQGGRQAVQHLLDNGYSRIAYIGGSQKELFNKRRLSGYFDALAEHGLPAETELVREGGTTRKDGMAMMNELLALPQRPDAVICSENILGLGAVTAIQKAGLAIPDDIGVMSFDNYPIADLLELEITTIDVDVYELGRQAATILFRMIENPEARQQQSLISTSIQARESTDRKHRLKT